MYGLLVFIFVLALPVSRYDQISLNFFFFSLFFFISIYLTMLSHYTIQFPYTLEHMVGKKIILLLYMVPGR